MELLRTAETFGGLVSWNWERKEERKRSRLTPALSSSPEDLQRDLPTLLHDTIATAHAQAVLTAFNDSQAAATALP